MATVRDGDGERSIQGGWTEKRRVPMQVFRGWVGDAVATIETTRSGAVLTCTDTVANEWSEEFSTEALAFLRLASLFQCAGSNWTCGFAVEPQEFERLGNEFFLQVVTQ